MLRFLRSERAVIILALIFTLCIVAFNVYDLAYDKSDSRAYTAQDIEDIEVDKVNINTADVEMLCTLDGIGEGTAQKIIDYREANGCFETIEQIMEVSGIGKVTFAQISPMITVE